MTHWAQQFLLHVLHACLRRDQDVGSEIGHLSISPQAPQKLLENQGIFGRGKTSSLWLFPNVSLSMVHRPSQLCPLPLFPSCRAKGLRQRAGWHSRLALTPPPASSPTLLSLPQAGLQAHPPGHYPHPPISGPPAPGTSLKDTAHSATRCGPSPPSLASHPAPSRYSSL